MDSITRIKEFIKSNFPDWEKISFSEFQENIDFRDDGPSFKFISG